jgi:hypothetical protein
MRTPWQSPRLRQRLVTPEYRFTTVTRFVLLMAVVACACSCTLLSQSPYLRQATTVPYLEHGSGLAVSQTGTIPYQRWRVAPWNDELQHVWLVGDYDFRRYRGVELILYFHGMHSKDYYRTFRKELESLAQTRRDRPFLFVGFVDTPYASREEMSKGRWNSLVPSAGERPDRLLETVNHVYKAFCKRFPHMRKDYTTITLAGFSGGGKVLDGVASWLARTGKEDPYAEVFRSRLRKFAYFDCWFAKDVADIVPALLQDNPGMKIVGTVHMDTPRKNAVLLANKFKMKADTKNRELVSPDGRLVIYANDSHWEAMIARLKEAL